MKLTYDKSARQAQITFENGHVLKVSNVSAEQAQQFFDRHAPEFEKRNCCLDSAGGHLMTRTGH